MKTKDVSETIKCFIQKPLAADPELLDGGSSCKTGHEVPDATLELDTKIGASFSGRIDISQYETKTSDYIKALGSRKKQDRIPVRKPDKTSWVHCHPEIEIHVSIYEDKPNREYYLVDPAVQHELGSTVFCAALFFAVTALGDYFLWIVKLNMSTRPNAWSQTHYDAAKMAQEMWIRMESNMIKGAYDIYIPEAHIAEPVWAEVDMEKVFYSAFKTKVINSADHPIILNLKGKLVC